MGGERSLQREHHVAAVGANGHAQLAEAQAKDLVLDLLRVGQLKKRVAGAYWAGFPERQVILLGEVVQRDLARLTNRFGNLVNRIRGLLFRLIERRLRAKGIPDLIEGLGVGRLLVEDFDNVKAVLRPDQIGDLVRS